MSAADRDPFVIAVGRGRRASVWLWQGAHGANLSLHRTFSGIAEAREWAEQYAEENGLVTVHPDDLKFYRGLRKHRARGGPGPEAGGGR